jgi:hypothetical protein
MAASVEQRRKQAQRRAEFNEPPKRERGSLGVLRACNIGHSDGDDSYRAGYLDGLTASRKGVRPAELTLDEAIDHAIGVRIHHLLRLLSLWCEQNEELASVYSRQVDEIRVRLEDVAESESPAEATATAQ